MLAREINDYWFQACRNLFGPYKEKYPILIEYGTRLDEELGVEEFKNYLDYTKDPVSLSEEMKQLLKALAGPHGKTLLRAYRIKKGLE